MNRKTKGAVSILPLALLSLLGACQPAATPTAPAPPPLSAASPKVAAARTNAGAELLSTCVHQDGSASWDVPAPPAKIHGSTYYVGTCGIAAVLIDTSDGLILIDAATQKGGPAVAASITALGFDPRQIRLLLTTHEHMDHAGGLAHIQRLSGAKLLARPSAHAALSTGQPDRDDPQFGLLDPMEPLHIGGELTDGKALAFGGIQLTPYATPVHTNGSTSYIWQSCERGDRPDACVTIAFMDSLSTPAPAAYRFTDQPHQRQRIEAGFAKAASLSCNLLITPHPSASGLWERLAGEKALLHDQACKDYVAAAKQIFENRLAKETK